jgi:hypothetical protein
LDWVADPLGIYPCHIGTLLESGSDQTHILTEPDGKDLMIDFPASILSCGVGKTIFMESTMDLNVT